LLRSFVTIVNAINPAGGMVVGDRVGLGAEVGVLMGVTVLHPVAPITSSATSTA
jgi:hypothetical protein